MNWLFGSTGSTKNRSKFQNVARQPLSNANAERMDVLKKQYATNGTGLEEFRALETKYGYAHLPEDTIRKEGNILIGYSRIQPVSRPMGETRATSPTSPSNTS